MPEDAPDKSVASQAEEAKEHRPDMDELQRTFRLQQEAAHAAELEQLALRYPSVKSLLEEVKSLRDAAAKAPKRAKN
jgi:hypothetical protein